MSTEKDPIEQIFTIIVNVTVIGLLVFAVIAGIIIS